MRTAAALTLLLGLTLPAIAHADLVFKGRSFVPIKDQRRAVHRIVDLLNRTSVVKELGRAVTAQDLPWNLGGALHLVRQPTNANGRGVVRVKTTLVPLGREIGAAVSVRIPNKSWPYAAHAEVIGVRVGRSAK